MRIIDLLESIKSSQRQDVKLFFVTRAIKAGAAKRALAKDKYLFNVYQIDCNEEVRLYLYEATINQLDRIIKKNYEMVDYDILSDETEHLFTYSIQNKVFSFKDVVTNQLQKSVPKVTSIASLTEREEMWAYCVEFYNSELEDSFFTFRKILPSRIGVDEKAKNSFRAFFNTESQQLRLLKEETVNLDEQIDCIYHQDAFYVIKKANFEQIVGLQEEFREKAHEIADKMIESGNFVGGDTLKELIDKKPSIHKKLIKVERIGGYKNLTPTILKSIKRVCKRHGEELPISNDKLSIENEGNIDTILRAFGDYYKIGEITGKHYGTFAGKELQTIN